MHATMGSMYVRIQHISQAHKDRIPRGGGGGRIYRRHDELVGQHVVVRRVGDVQLGEGGMTSVFAGDYKPQADAK